MEEVKLSGENRVLQLANGVAKADVVFSRLKPEDVRVTKKRVASGMPSAPGCCPALLG